MKARLAAGLVGLGVALSLAAIAAVTSLTPLALAGAGALIAAALAALVGGLVDKDLERLQDEASDKEVMEDALGKFVHSRYVSTLMLDPSALEPGGVQKFVTVLMSDLRGFTSLVERYPPDEFIELLNAYLGRMADVVKRHGGSVNEFIGDAVLALFGARDGDFHDPLAAAACAADMQQELARFNEEHPDIPELQMGIGLASGKVIVGNIGSEHRLKFGVVGDTVNLAGRVESFTVGGEVLLADSTYRLCKAGLQVRGPREVRAKGKTEPLLVWSLVSVGPPHDLVVPAALGAHDALHPLALKAYVFKIAGKHVAKVPFEAAVTGLSVDAADLVCPADSVALFDDIKLRFDPPAGEPIEELYGKIVAAEVLPDGRRRRRVRFTSVPDPARLQALLPDHDSGDVEGELGEH